MSGYGRFMMTIMVAAGMLCAGCEQQNEIAAPAPVEADAVATRQKKEAQVIVPAEVQGKWRAVKISVTDKENHREKIFTVAIGSSFTVPDSKIRLQVDAFLPAFIVDGTIMTSVSNETRNPAVQITISDEEREVFKGWLFSLFPGTHAYQHPRYSFALVDYLAAK